MAAIPCVGETVTQLAGICWSLYVLRLGKPAITRNIKKPQILKVEINDYLEDLNHQDLIHLSQIADVWLEMATPWGTGSPHLAWQEDPPAWNGHYGQAYAVGYLLPANQGTGGYQGLVIYYDKPPFATTFPTPAVSPQNDSPFNGTKWCALSQSYLLTWHWGLPMLPYAVQQLLRKTAHHDKHQVCYYICISVVTIIWKPLLTFFLGRILPTITPPSLLKKRVHNILS